MPSSHSSIRPVSVCLIPSTTRHVYILFASSIPLTSLQSQTTMQLFPYCHRLALHASMSIRHLYSIPTPAIPCPSLTHAEVKKKNISLLQTRSKKYISNHRSCTSSSHPKSYTITFARHLHHQVQASSSSSTCSCPFSVLDSRSCRSCYPQHPWVLCSSGTHRRGCWQVAQH